MPIVGTRRVRIYLVNLETGNVSADLILSTVPVPNVNFGRWLMTDGLNVFAGYNNSVTEALDTLVPNGNTYTIRKTETPSGFVDVCFDGHFAWVLGGANVNQRNDGNPNGTNSKAWAHGVATARGIMTDGMNIMVMEA